MTKLHNAPQIYYALPDQLMDAEKLQVVKDHHDLIPLSLYQYKGNTYGYLGSCKRKDRRTGAWIVCALYCPAQQMNRADPEQFVRDLSEFKQRFTLYRVRLTRYPKQAEATTPITVTAE